MSHSVLGEPLREHLDPPEYMECVTCDDECRDCYTAADRAMDEAIDELDGLVLAEERQE